MGSLPAKICGIVNKRNKIFSSQRPGLQVLYNLTVCCSTNSSFRQLQELGCKGFAVLWDDIEPELTEEDAKHFTSFAEAHCKVFLPRPRLNILLVLSIWPKKFISTKTESEPFHPSRDNQVTNSLHETLQHPKMLLCPVEYCSSRAVPGRLESSKLCPMLTLFWNFSIRCS